MAAQLADMREHSLCDAAVAGTPVNAAVDEVAAGSADARVSSFIGVLVGSARSDPACSCGPPSRPPSETRWSTTPLSTGRPRHPR